MKSFILIVALVFSFQLMAKDLSVGPYITKCLRSGDIGNAGFLVDRAALNVRGPKIELRANYRSFYCVRLENGSVGWQLKEISNKNPLILEDWQRHWWKTVRYIGQSTRNEGPSPIYNVKVELPLSKKLFKRREMRKLRKGRRSVKKWFYVFVGHKVTWNGPMRDFERYNRSKGYYKLSFEIQRLKANEYRTKLLPMSLYILR